MPPPAVQSTHLAPGSALLPLQASLGVGCWC